MLAKLFKRCTSVALRQQSTAFNRISFPINQHKLNLYCYRFFSTQKPPVDQEKSNDFSNENISDPKQPENSPIEDNSSLEQANENIVFEPKKFNFTEEDIKMCKIGQELFDKEGENWPSEIYQIIEIEKFEKIREATESLGGRLVGIGTESADSIQYFYAIGDAFLYAEIDGYYGATFLFCSNQGVLEKVRDILKSQDIVPLERKQSE